MSVDPNPPPAGHSSLHVALAALDRIDVLLARYGLHLALAVAWAAMLGSLYFSEVRNFDPCVLCWYQRIVLYPIALLLPVGMIRREQTVHVYVLTLSLLCIPMSVYHYLLQKTSWFDPHAVCRRGVPCSAMYIDWLGFITIPFLALVAAVLIALATSAWSRRRAALPPDEAQRGRPWKGVVATIGAVIAFYVGVYFVIG